MNEHERALMEGPSIETDGFCAICGRSDRPLNRHHIVPRSRGGEDGPTVVCCGFGNNLQGLGPEGKCVTYCHGALHMHLLHLRWTGEQWEKLWTHEPTKYEDALKMDGWEPIGPRRYRHKTWTLGEAGWPIAF